VAVDDPCPCCGVPVGPADWCQVETCPGFGLRGAELDAGVAAHRSRPGERSRTLSADEVRYMLEVLEVDGERFEVEHRWD
jgi:hypothetical protein